MNASPKASPPARYQFGLAAVAVAMVVLPILYAALTVAAAWGVYVFATEYFPAIWAWPIGLNKISLLLKVLCSFTPLLVGGAIALFMVKPLFAGRGARMQPLALDPAVEPRVYQIVQDVCEIVGAPSPRRIELNCDLNASASFDGGLRGFLRNKLILTLGLPLVAGLTQRELAGVIAHEFGHFRQGAGMRFSYLIRRVNGWFARVIYERDAWDETIESWCGTDSLWVNIMVGCARFGVWVSRRVLWVLMIFGHALCALLMRQMEFDADRCEVRVAGSAAFESTMVKLATLGNVLGDIHREMQRVWRTNLQLPDNLPVLVEYRAARLPGADRVKIENAVGLAKTGLLDTHPSAAERIARARAAAEPGLEISDEPARELFDHFDAVSRLVTLAHYEDDLDVPTSPDFLIPLEQLVREKSDAVASAPPEPAPMPMMAYDPTRFRRPEPPAAD